jgi:hypothetical protein
MGCEIAAYASSLPLAMKRQTTLHPATELLHTETTRARRKGLFVCRILVAGVACRF